MAEPLASHARKGGPNPVEATLHLFVDALARIPGPHQKRIVSSGTAQSTTAPTADVSTTAAGTPRSLLQPSIIPHPSRTTKEELGRATWTFLHVLAAQWPSEPTRQQQKDANTLVDVLTRIYPCADCADHFQQVVREHPPRVSRGEEFQQWMCKVHNIVNRSIGKPTFNCDLVAARWGALECGEDLACDLSIGRPQQKR